MSHMTTNCLILILVLLVLLDLIARWHRRDLGRWRHSLHVRQAWFHACPEAILILDQQGNISDLNEGTERLFGLGRDQLLERDLRALLEPERSADAIREVMMLLLPPTMCKSHETECTGRHGDGTDFPLRLHCRRLDC